MKSLDRSRLKDQGEPMKAHDRDVDEQKSGAEQHERDGERQDPVVQHGFTRLRLEQEPPKERQHGHRDRDEQRRSGPAMAFRRCARIGHAPAPARRQAQIDKTRGAPYSCAIMPRFKIKAPDIVIFLGLAVNAVIIVLILLYFVF